MKTTIERKRAMYNPPYPGEILRELYLQPLEMTVGEAARRLDVSRKQLSMLLNGRAGVSPAMALRLGKATDTTPESWLNLQQARDLWEARKRNAGIKVKKLEAA